MAPAYPHAPPVNYFELRSVGKLGWPHPASVSERLAISSLCWHLLAFRRDVDLSSSLINNYSLCGPPDRPCILMTARVGAKRREREGAGEWSGVAWSGVEWSGVRGECKMGSISCIFHLKAQHAASNRDLYLGLRPEGSDGRLIHLMVNLIQGPLERKCWGQNVCNQITYIMCCLVAVVQRHELMLLNGSYSPVK